MLQAELQTEFVDFQTCQNLNVPLAPLLSVYRGDRGSGIFGIKVYIIIILGKFWVYLMRYNIYFMFTNSLLTVTHNNDSK